MVGGANGCFGALAITHRTAGNPNSAIRTRTFRPFNYPRTIRAFRGREIVTAQVWGTCPWRLHSRTRFRGQYVGLPGGFNSHVNLVPFSISQQ